VDLICTLVVEVAEVLDHQNERRMGLSVQFIWEPRYAMIRPCTGVKSGTQQKSRSYRPKKRA